MNYVKNTDYASLAIPTFPCIQYVIFLESSFCSFMYTLPYSCIIVSDSAFAPYNADYFRSHKCLKYEFPVYLFKTIIISCAKLTYYWGHKLSIYKAIHSTCKMDQECRLPFVQTGQNVNVCCVALLWDNDIASVR